jgi:transglutaminase-like putative cysteine protease
VTTAPAPKHTAADRLFERALLGLLVSGFLALASTGELSPVVLGLSVVGFTARILLLVFQRAVAVPVWVVNTLVILYAGFYPLDFVYLSGDFLGSTVRLICFLTVVKGLTFRTDRDALYAVLIGFTQLLAAALLSASLLFFVFLTLFLFCGVATFAVWEIRRGGRGARAAIHGSSKGFFRRIVTVSVATSLGILVFTVGLFFILPRTARAALQNLVSNKFHLPGFGGEVDLRKIGEIQTSSRTIMYVRIPNHGDVLTLRWRGSAMSRFDGKRWMTSGDLAEQIRLRYGTTAIPIRTHGGRAGVREKYEVQLTETGMNALFVAGIPELLEANVGSIAVLSNGTLRTMSDMPAVLRYNVTSFFDKYGGDGTPVLTRDELRRLLEIPRGFDKRIFTLAQQAAGTENNQALQARRIVDYLQSNYGYTLELPSEEQGDPIAHFLFERKRGHCEYFASSMALMLRSLGIPSRVVTGFQGGTLNPVNGWYTVRASDAHSWVEAFIPGNGWTAFDPTPAAGRIPHVSMFARVTNLIEAADLFWQDWVVQYDLERQFKLASSLEQTRFGTRTSGVVGFANALREGGQAFGLWVRGHLSLLVFVGVLAVLAWVVGPGLLVRLRERRQRERLAAGRVGASDATVLYQQLLVTLEGRQIRKPAWFTPMEFAEKLPASELAGEVAAFTRAYNRLRFGNDPGAAGEMLAIYDRIRAGG